MRAIMAKLWPKKVIFNVVAATILGIVAYDFSGQKFSSDLILDFYIKFGANPFKNG